MKPWLHFFIITPLLILWLSPISQAQPGGDYVYHICPNDTVFTTNSIYQTNLNQTLSSLSSNANRTSGFHNASAGNNAFGLFLCQGDVPAGVCQDFLDAAIEDTRRRCPVEVNAFAWYDGCFLRYSNRSFFSRLETSPRVYLWNTGNITNRSAFDSLLATNMREAAARAAVGTPEGRKIAVKESNFTAFQKLYSLVQCTPDLSSTDCSRCLEEAISQLPACCGGKQGGRVLTPSCIIRYETYPFYNVTAFQLPSSPPPSSPENLPPPTSPGTGGSNGGISTATIIAIVAPISVTVILFCLGFVYLRRRARRKYDTVPGDNTGVNEITTVESLQFNLNTIQVATNNFSEDHKLGEGGFGEVYKGTLPNGQEIAVKKLSKSSAQGSEEFKNEVLLLAKLQHRNLVRLLGFCLEGDEKILVYEYVPNKSLDFFLFDEEKQRELDWSRRYKIIGGIARGILYLHEDSRLRIIHRDLKASNILLDRDMNAKISDFGMAKIFVVDQTQGNTSRIVGTYGYMSPEYAMHGHFSVKSDIYSFGVLVLEIICGKKNSSFYQTDGAHDLSSYVWKHWRDGTPLEVLDPVVADSYSRNEVLRCIQIGLLCVQEDPADRPTMATVVLMLNSYSVTLPMPQQPAFLLQSRTGDSWPSKGLKSESYSTTVKSVSDSVDEASITQVHPR